MFPRETNISPLFTPLAPHPVGAHKKGGTAICLHAESALLPNIVLKSAIKKTEKGFR
jgi:hypothetical protein